jgi:2-deoxystreptamine N-acetyl-D-glucosaminyltransferase/2-deoxystreptamine glucosyltransferase
VIVGDGPELARLRRRAADLGVEGHCLFPGIRRDVEGIYPLLDVFVLPSVREPFGLTLLEAMATGLPVVATAAGGPPDFVRHGVNGLLVPPRDVGALARAVESVLADAPLARRLAAGGRATAGQEYPITATAGMVAGVYLEVLGLAASPGTMAAAGPQRRPLA